MLIWVILTAFKSTIYANETNFLLIPNQQQSSVGIIDEESRIEMDKNYQYCTTVISDSTVEIIRINKENPQGIERVYSNYKPRRKTALMDSILITLKFDKRYARFYIINKDYFISEYNSDFNLTKVNDYQFEGYIPGGTYKILTKFIGSPVHLIIKNDIQINQDTTISIRSDEAKNYVYFEGVDENGNLISNRTGVENILRGAIVFNQRSNRVSSYWSSSEKYFRISDLTDGVLIASQQFFWERAGTDVVYSVRFPILEKITSDTVFTNSPNDFIEQDFCIQFPPYSTTRMIYMGKSFRHVGLASGNGTGLLFNEFEWNGKLYINSEPSDSFVHSVKIGGEIGKGEDTKTFVEVPTFKVFQQKVGTYYHQCPVPVDYLSPDGERLIYGNTPVISKAIHLNNVYNENEIICYNFTVGSLREDRNYESQNADITISDSAGTEVISMLEKDFDPLQVSAGKYCTEITFNDFNIGGITAKGILKADYDLRNEDPNPPIFTTFRILNSQDKPVTTLKYDEHYKLQVSAADFMVICPSKCYDIRYLKYKKINSNSTKIYVKSHNATEWISLDYRIINEDTLHKEVTYMYSFGTNGLNFFPTGVLYEANLDTIFNTTSLDFYVSIMDSSGNRTEWSLSPACLVENTTTQLNAKKAASAPSQYVLHPNYPNPFNPSTHIQFEMPIPSNVTVSIYNANGQMVEILTKDRLEAGVHSLTWNAIDYASGLYFIKMKADNFIQIRKCVILK
ncbi:T9SS type A sorting domain-containing protein [candidate division KSB1 bacterium]|nr:T9SS type A sorting domain-containing protein [candidate division KSB1 bacterium]